MFRDDFLKVYNLISLSGIKANWLENVMDLPT